MKRKKYLKILGCFAIFLFILTLLIYLQDNNHVILENSKGNNIINTNSLTMMYETDVDSGEYQISSDTTWPQDGYIFNETLSRCENGSTLTWDDENKKILIQTNTSDKCYVYFDIYMPELIYAYLIDSNSEFSAFEDYSSDTQDEILFLVDSYNATLDFNGQVLSKNASASNINDMINYGINSVLYVRNSNARIASFFMDLTRYESLPFYILNSQVTIESGVIQSDISEYMFNIKNSEVSLRDITINNDSSKIVVSGTSSLSLDNLANFSSNNLPLEIEIAKESNSIITLGNITSELGVNIKMNSNANVTINNDVTIDICINSDNTNSDIYLNNNGVLSLNCDSYITQLNDNNNYQNINSNGHSIYYDRNYNQDLNGATISLNGGGSLTPYN